MAPIARPKAAKPSKVVKPKKNTKRTTSSSKNFRFQPFSERIAKLKIDPVRKRRNVEDHEELRDNTSTYFGRALEEWRDLNLSQTFASFAKEVAPLCDGLPMLLYNEGKIMDILLSYIEKGDELAMESLLSLVAHYAHDLDTRFEKHFQRAVSTISAVAAHHPDPAVVEWSFTCLAWLFKYLSRLLTPDLRPLYDLLSPYLGKETQKPYIVRFAAESVSFLLRKTAATFERDEEPLNLIIGHVLGDCRSTRHEATGELHRQGVMVLLTEAVKGVQLGIHSSGSAIVQCMLKHASTGPLTHEDPVFDIVEGTLTSLIHHTNPETFRPLQNVIIQSIRDNILASNLDSVRLHSVLIYTIVSVRKGSRISSWAPLCEALKSFAQSGQLSTSLDSPGRKAVLNAVAITFSLAPMDAMLPSLAVFELVRGGQWSQYFLPFCDLFKRLSSERFDSFLAPHLQKFVSEHWRDYGDAIFLALPRIGGDNLKLSCPEDLQNTIIDKVRLVSTSTSNAPDTKLLSAASAALAAIPHIKLGQKVVERLATTLRTLINSSLDRRIGGHQELDDFALGICFDTLLSSMDDTTPAPEFWRGLCLKSEQVAQLPLFWSNVARYLKLPRPSSIELEGPHTLALENALAGSLSSPSHQIRLCALDVMREYHKMRSIPIPDTVETAFSTEEIRISVDTSRNISMNIRRMSSEFTRAIDTWSSLVRRAIPIYCFGLLHFRLSQAWEDAIAALGDIAQNPCSEELITSIAQKWLDDAPAESDAAPAGLFEPILNGDSGAFQIASDFECSNMAKISAICRQVFETPESGHLSVEAKFRAVHERVPPVSSTARGQALKVLNKLPALAEKKSRMLVPVLLRWAGNSEADSTEPPSSTSRWSRKDQKAMLSVFAQFVNPKVLYKSRDAYEALLKLCANGDVEIQQSGLKAVLAWKDPAVKPYAEHLNNLLDEARFREEIAVFLQNAHEEDAEIKQEHLSDLMPVLLRLLYGRAVAGGKHGQNARRKAIFVALSRFGKGVLDMFVKISLGSASDAPLLEDESINEDALCGQTVPLRQQLGMLNMMDDMLGTLGSELESSGVKLLNAVLLYTISASRQLESASEPSDGSLLRAVRQTGLQCLVRIFTMMEELDLSAYAKVVVEELLNPRMEKFTSENLQSVSAMLRLMSAWSSSANTVQYLVRYNSELLEKVAALLAEPNAKDEVQLFILRSVVNSLLLHQPDKVLGQSGIAKFVRSIGGILNQQPSKELLDACVSTFSQLANHISSSSQAEDVMRVSTKLLTQPNKLVSPPTKTGLLKTMLPLIDNFNIQPTCILYDAICGLFSRLTDQNSRILLSSVLTTLCSKDAALIHSAQICQDLNSLGARLDEPDHDRRVSGFTNIYKQAAEFSYQQWQPIVHNCLFFVRDAEDKVNRSSASMALQRFVTAGAAQGDSFKPLVLGAVLPGIEYGMKSTSEFVRAEYLRLLGHIVASFPEWTAFNDMRGLTGDGDDEASFFLNALDIQQHRRLGALRRLAQEADTISSNHVTKILVPFLEHFVFDQTEDDAGRTLADQTVKTLGALARALRWSAFKASFRRYTNSLTSDPDHEKIVLRLLGAMVEALDAREETSQDGTATAKTEKEEVIQQSFLPPLVAYLHQRDESTVDRRMPVAVTIVKLLCLLPEAEMTNRLAPVLTDVSHVLRSRSQEARDQTRKTLATILARIGPAYLGFMVKELRGALQRGYQLHVLSFTVHSLLVNVIEVSQPGDLNHCLNELISIIMDDIFGVTGQEKDAEEYKSGMKEIKSSKSFDTMELLARVTQIQRLGQLIQPLRALLSERLDAKTLKRIDDLMTRLRKGVDQNPAADSRDMLVFCHEIVRQVYAEQNAPAAVAQPVDQRFSKFLIRGEGGKKSKNGPASSTQLFKLVSFALNLLRKIIRRHDDLQTPANMAGFLGMAGDALVQGEGEVQVAAARLLATIMRLPMPELDNNAPAYVKEAVGLIKTATSMTTDSAKAALELITAVLREKRSVTIKDRDIADVLKAIKADIDEPDRQGIIYKFLRGVLGRKIMATEVYALMDEVGKVVVVNADRNVRESARSAYLQFVLEYPQGKDRWNKQAAFFVENLKYDRPAGRQSVMELLNSLLTKLSDEVLAQLGFTLFIALVPVQVSDTDQSCRQMAAILIGKLFERADDDQMGTYLTLMGKWMSNGANQTICVASLQCWMVMLRTKPPSTQHVVGLRDALQSLLVSDEEGANIGEGWRATTALETFQVLVHDVPTVAFAKQSAEIWRSLQTCLRLPHSEAKENAAKLIGVYLTHFASTSSKSGEGLSALPLRGSHGLQLTDKDMRQMCSASLRALRGKAENLSEAFAAQTVDNLILLGRFFAANGMTWKAEQDASESEVDEDRSNEQVPQRDPSALAYLFNRLSYIVRQDVLPPLSRTAALQCQTALLPHTKTIPDLQAVLRPLYLLTDASIPQPPGEAHKKVVDKARELMDAVQTKIGSERFVSELGVARAEVKERREERRRKRKVEAVSRPEKAEKGKRRKHDVKKLRVKARGEEQRGKRRGW